MQTTMLHKPIKLGLALAGIVATAVLLAGCSTSQTSSTTSLQATTPDSPMSSSSPESLEGNAMMQSGSVTSPTPAPKAQNSDDAAIQEQADLKKLDTGSTSVDQSLQDKQGSVE